MDKKKLEELINDLTINGQLPLPYYKSKIIEKKIKVNSNISFEKKVTASLININKKYKQVKVASGYLGRLNTKIYDLY